MDKHFTGYGPALDDECSIRVTYLDASTLQSPSFVKDTFNCKHSSHAGCRMSNCPIYRSAPDALQ